MTRVTPWSDAARALVGAAFGDPTMRNEADKIDLQRQQVQQDAKRLLLEEAFNPAKISQAEAAARYSNAQADNEGLTFTSRQDFLNGGGGDSPPTYPPATSPYANGGNPALGANVDDIVPAISEADIAELTGMPVSTGRTDPPPMGMQGMGPAPSADPTFEQVLAGLTAPEQTAPPVMQNPMAAPPAMQAPVQQAPMTLEQMLTPTVRQMITAGYMPETSLPDLLLAIEGQSANQGVTDPTQRLTNAAAGRGTFVTPDQLSASAMNNNLPSAAVANRGFENMLPTSVQEFKAGQADPAFMDYLNMKEAQPGFTVTNKDGTTVTYGKQGNPNKLTEQGSKVAIAARTMAPGIAALTDIYDGKKSISQGALAMQSVFGDNMLATDVAQSAGVINPDDQIIDGAVNSVMNFLYLQTGAARTEGEDARGYIELTPLASDTPGKRALKKAAFQQKAMSVIDQAPNEATRQELIKALGGVFDFQIPAAEGQAPTAGATTINTREEYDALPPGSTYIDAMTGQQARKP